ncbi:hypothetical protein UFOVP1351_40 [uncultured Caudovirales phage]|uniref:dATP/dGTP diphosphohydrolase N-terminal domain-containing protein n=1 Tax=uncultured Caudovirales phage TaxID=2100421 RepID=A0A6J5S1P0_9CAUD|nr:hypothetical protein UFOVP1351_40 [uncultured Caudovirales phage]
MRIGRCIDNTDYKDLLTVDKEYKLRPARYGGMYIVTLDDGSNCAVYKRRFELVTESTPAAQSVQGVKHDAGKPPISLIPAEAIFGEAKVFAFGAGKYGKHNFRLGMDHTRVLDAAMRHILAIVRGEDVDPESGEPHWAHARCCLAMYAYYQTNSVGTDDRYKGDPK